MANTPGPSDTDAGVDKNRAPAPTPKRARRGRTGRRKARPHAGKPKTIPPQAVPPKAVAPEAVAPKLVPPKAVAPKAVAPKAAAPKAVPPKATAPKPVQPKAAKAHPIPAAQTRTTEPRRVADAPTDDPLIGQTIGRCRIDELVGVGKTGLVYRAHYEALDDVVAVKILRSEIARNPVLVERFQSEARAIAKVDNENVLKIYDVGQERGLYYMVVEFLDGEEVFEVIKREGQVDPMDALRIIRQAANGLKAAHGHDLVHRDIKPQNLFLLEDGTVKVVDFGLATGFDDSSERVGTPHYMAPEVCEHGNAEFASDIYGLGIVLYHLLVGQPPFAGKDIQAILRAHMESPPLRVRQRRPSVPKKVSDILQHLTKRDPMLRPSATRLVEELDATGGEQLKKKDTLKKRTRSSRARSAVARRDRRGRKSATPAVVAISVVVGAALLFAVLGGKGDKPARTPDGLGAGSSDAADTPPVHVVPVETAKEKKSREERLFLAEREEKSKEAFKNAEAYARRIWRQPSDTDAVLSKYRSVISRFKKMSGAAMAKTRIAAIKNKELHPHPDRELTSAARLASVRETWATNKASVLEHIAAFDYAKALTLVPAAVSDESGEFQKELDFWRTHTSNLVDYRKALVKEVRQMASEDRLLETPEGEGEIGNITERAFDVRVGNKSFKFTWSEIGADAIAALGFDALSDKDARLMLLQLAFAYAHGLKDGFWDAKMTLESTPGASAWSRATKTYRTRFQANK